MDKIASLGSLSEMIPTSTRRQFVCDYVRCKSLPSTLKLTDYLEVNIMRTIREIFVEYITENNSVDEWLEINGYECTTDEDSGYVWWEPKDEAEAVDSILEDIILYWGSSRYTELLEDVMDPILIELIERLPMDQFVQLKKDTLRSQETKDILNINHFTQLEN